MYACTKITAGFDCGNGLAKAVFNLDGTRSFVKMPSYLYMVSSSTTVPFSGPAGAVVHYIEGSRADLKDTKWLVGSTAYNNEPTSRISVAENRGGKVDYGLQMFLGCLSQLDLTGIVSVSVATSVHDKQRWAKEMNSAYNGTHRVNLNGTEVTVTIKSGCVEEGYGALYYLQTHGKIQPNSLIGTVDIGYGTIIGQIYEPDKKGRFESLKRSLFIADIGVRDLVVQMAVHDSLSGPLRGRADIEVIRASLESAAESGNSVMPYGLTHHSMAEAYKSTVKKWFDAGIRQAINALKPWEVSATFYAIGGGTKLPGLAKYLGDINPITGRPYFQSVDKAHIVNAEGLLIASGAIR